MYSKLDLRAAAPRPPFGNLQVVQNVLDAREVAFVERSHSSTFAPVS